MSWEESRTEERGATYSIFSKKKKKDLPLLYAAKDATSTFKRDGELFHTDLNT